MNADTPHDYEPSLIAELQAKLAAAEARAAATEAKLTESQVEIRQLTAQRDAFRDAYERTRIELLLLKRRIFVGTAERVDTTQLRLEFAEKAQAFEAMAAALGEAAQSDLGDGSNPPEPPPGSNRKPRGRRNLREMDLQEQRFELTDPVFDRLVAEGKAKLIGYEESARLAWERGGMRVLVVARAKYQTIDRDGESVIETTPMPAETFERCMAAPSLLAHIAIAKHCDGMPLARLEGILKRDGVDLDRGTMCRWVEDIGSTVGATIVHAMRADAFCTAFCIATDATGVRIQPHRVPGKRQSCDRGHFFVQIADRDHILFTYTKRETCAAVAEMFKGFKGYVQADAKNVFEILFSGRPYDDQCTEVGCWAHARRKFWEAAVAKFAVGREGLLRIQRIFELDATWKSRPPNDIKQLRQTHLKPLVEAFVDWAAVEYKKVEEIRGLVRDALGYVVRQRGPLLAFLEDGRLEMTNNRSERGLRGIAVGRKAWLFCGSDGHAEAAANLMSLIASAKLQKLDPELYLREIIRVLPHWPRDRYLELAPKYWAATRARLDAGELAAEYGELTVPEPSPQDAAVQESGSN